MKSIHEYIKLIEAEQQGYDPTETPWQWTARMLDKAKKLGHDPDFANARDQFGNAIKKGAAIATGVEPPPVPSELARHKEYVAANKDKPLDPTKYSPAGLSKTGWDVKPQATAQATPGTAPASGTAATTTPTAKPTPTAKTAPTAKPAFKDLGAQYGYNSPQEVQAIQQQLVSMGYPIAVDGKFGPKTQEAYRQAYTQMYGQPPGQPEVAQQTGVTARASQNPATGQTTYTNAPQGQSLPQANVAGAPSQQKQDLLNKAAELTKAGDTARAKIYTDAASRMKESTELDRIKDLIKY